MTIREKCRAFFDDTAYAQSLGYPVNPRMAEALGLYPYFLPIDASDGGTVTMRGRRFVMIGSNNYLGLTTHPEVVERAADALRRYGTGCTGSRFLNGTLRLHVELEQRLAAFVGKEAALVFSTGYTTNLGTISALLGRDDVVVTDKDDHASILDGIALRKGLRGTERRDRMRIFRHNDAAHLDAVLSEYDAAQNILVAVDGVFSMEGDIADLPAITAVCRRHGALLMVDDAHAIGVLGGGHGTAAHFGCTHDVDLITGTFSKSLASTGGFVAGNRDIIHWIQHMARPLIFSASLSPPNAATALAALDVIVREPERIARVHSIGARMRERLGAMGFDMGQSATPIVPVILGDQYRAMQAWSLLFKQGVYVNVALPPAVPARRALLRTSYMATHRDEDLDAVCDAFAILQAKLQRRGGNGRARGSDAGRDIPTNETGASHEHDSDLPERGY